MSALEPCPECQQSKHLNCDGTTWNPATDEPDECPCAKRGHEDEQEITDDELPGMWERADLSGGWADTEAAAAVRRARREKRAAEEKAWAEKSGPVIVEATKPHDFGPQWPDGHDPDSEEEQ